MKIPGRRRNRWRSYAWAAVTPFPHSLPLASSCPLTKKRSQLPSRGKCWQRLGLTRPNQVFAPEGKDLRGHDCSNSCSCPELRFLKGEANQTSADLLLKNFPDPMIVLQPSVGWNGTSNRVVHPFTTMAYFLVWPSDTLLPKLEFVSCPNLSLEQYSPPAILKVFPCYNRIQNLESMILF